MNKQEWLECADPMPMLKLVHGKVSDRKYRLFACACCRAIWTSLVDKRSQEAVEVAEAFADGKASNEDRLAAFEEAWDAREAARKVSKRAYFDALAAEELVENETSGLYCGWYTAARNSTLTNSQHTNLIRCIFGNPFCRATINPAWLAWNDGTVRRIAQGIYDERAFDRLPILADALEDAECADENILNHCRQTSVHVRGCWVLDILLGKE